MKDIDIARSVPDEYIEQYGKYKAKISNKYMKKTS